MELDKLNQQEEIDMLKQIDINYKDLKLPVIEPKYDKDKKLQNEKEIKKKLKQFTIIISTLWLANYTISSNTNKNIISNTFAYYNALKSNVGTFKISIAELKSLSEETISTPKWNKIMDKIILERQNQVKIKQVIKGNVNILNKKVQDTVMQMYKDGKSWPQTQKKLQQEFGYNKNKAKSIAITEKNYYKSKAQLEATKGMKIKKTWIHNRAKDPREAHLYADGQVADENGYFHVNGYKALAPQQFGIASEDINCHCTMKIEVLE